MELEQLKEKEKIDNVSVTSPEDDKEKTALTLNNTTVPTVEEQEDAGITPTPALDAESESNNAEPAEVNEGGNIDAEAGVAESSTERMFTQSQVDEIAGKARKEGREKALRDEYARYGVNSMEELDDLFSDAQRYVTAKEDFDVKEKEWNETSKARDSELEGLKNQLAELNESVALMKSGIDQNRYEDAKFILKGKGLDITVENINNELATHPEWKATQGPAAKPSEASMAFTKVAANPASGPGAKEAPTQINVLGNHSAAPADPEVSDYDKAMNMFFRK